MEPIRGALITLVYVLLCEHQRIFGTEVKVRVKAGDNVTLFCDCVIPVGFYISWIKNNSYGNQSLSISPKYLFERKFPRFSFVLNSSGSSYDLYIENISVYDDGIYYCAKAERKISSGINGTINNKMEYQYRNRRTHLAVVDPVSSEHPRENTECDVEVCWSLLISVCSVCVLLSSLFSAACVYCFCRPQTTGSELNAKILEKNFFKVDQRDKHQCEMIKTGKFCLHTEVTYRLLPSAHPYTKM